MPQTVPKAAAATVNAHLSPALSGSTFTRTITREQREAIWEDILEYPLKAAWGDVLMALADGKGDQARNLASNFRGSMAMLDAIGWDRVTDDAELTLTFDEEMLATVRWLCDEATGHLSHLKAEFQRERDPEHETVEWHRDYLNSLVPMLTHERAAVAAYEVLLGGVG